MKPTILQENTELTKRHFACRVYHSYFHYLRTHFPHIDLEALCLESGLPLSYLLDESNWVSVEFDRRFTERCLIATGKKDLCYRVGEQAVSPEVMGKVVTFILKSTFSINRIYGLLPKLTSVFSKVTEVTILERGQTFIDLRLRAVGGHLNPAEREALLANMPHIFQNTIGHYAALPTIHQLPPAKISFTETIGEDAFPEYAIHIDFAKSMVLSLKSQFLLFMAAMAAVVTFRNQIFYGSTEIALASALLLSLIAFALLAYRYTAAQKGLRETVDSLRELDQRYQSLQEAKEFTQALSKAYVRFVPWEFLRYLNRESITEVKFGDHVEKEMTVLFADLRDFTMQSESWTPKETFNFLNAHLARISPIIRENGGFIDKYIGDCVMAVFPSDATGAVLAAKKMIECSEAYNRDRESYGLKPLKMGIGINTGRVIFGTVGYSEHMQGTVISDAVNLASRFEGLSKTLGASIVIGENTLKQMNASEGFSYRDLGLIDVRGRDEKVRLYQVFCSASEKQMEMFKTTERLFTTGLKSIEAGEWSMATACFQKVLELNPADKAAEYHLNRLPFFGSLPKNRITA